MKGIGYHPTNNPDPTICTENCEGCDGKIIIESEEVNHGYKRSIEYLNDFFNSHCNPLMSEKDQEKQLIRKLRKIKRQYFNS